MAAAAQIMEYEGQQIVVVIWHKEELSATAAAVESKNIYPAGKWLGWVRYVPYVKTRTGTEGITRLEGIQTVYSTV